MSGADHESLSRGISGDMSSDAIARRLDIASQLYQLARTLSGAEYQGHVESDGEDTDAGSHVRESRPDYEHDS